MFSIIIKTYQNAMQYKIYQKENVSVHGIITPSLIAFQSHCFSNHSSRKSSSTMTFFVFSFCAARVVLNF